MSCQFPCSFYLGKNFPFALPSTSRGYPDEQSRRAATHFISLPCCPRFRRLARFRALLTLIKDVVRYFKVLRAYALLSAATYFVICLYCPQLAHVARLPASSNARENTVYYLEYIARMSQCKQLRTLLTCLHCFQLRHLSRYRTSFTHRNSTVCCPEYILRTSCEVSSQEPRILHRSRTTLHSRASPDSIAA